MVTIFITVCLYNFAKLSLGISFQQQHIKNKYIILNDMGGHSKNKNLKKQQHFLDFFFYEYKLSIVWNWFVE